MQSNKKEFPLVHIIFYDHLESSMVELRPARCEVFGILAKEDDLAYYVANWIYEETLEDHNSSGHCILKSTVISYEQVVGGEANELSEQDEE